MYRTLRPRRRCVRHDHEDIPKSDFAVSTGYSMSVATPCSDGLLSLALRLAPAVVVGSEASRSTLLRSITYLHQLAAPPSTPSRNQIAIRGTPYSQLLEMGAIFHVLPKRSRRFAAKTATRIGTRLERADSSRQIVANLAAMTALTALPNTAMWERNGMRLE